MSDDEQIFESSDNGPSQTFSQKATDIRKGGFIVIKGRPCKVVSISISKTGKHGHLMFHFSATDIFTSEKLEVIVPSSQDCDVPVVNRKQYQMVDISEDGFVRLMNVVKLPTDEALLTQLKAGFEGKKDTSVVVLTAMGEEQICAVDEVGAR